MDESGTLWNILATLIGLVGGAAGLVSLTLGLILGGGYMVSQTRPVTGDWWIVYVYWFGVVIYGLAIGLLASGFYDQVVDILKRLLVRAE
jgi:formate-dependent nitrite reductase membrane component NrfD